MEQQARACEYGDPFNRHHADHYVVTVRPMPGGDERLSTERHYICDKHFHEIDKGLRRNAWKQYLRCISPPSVEIEG